MAKNVEVQPFRPWRLHFAISLVLMAAGVACLWHALLQRPPQLAQLAVGLGVMVLGGQWGRWALARWSGKRLERTCLKGLKLPADWGVTPNYMLRGGGDIDLVIESPTGACFAVEIKSTQDVQVRGGFLFLIKPKLVRSNGKSLGDDHLAQAQRNARRIGGKAVLWYPRSNTTGTTELDDVLVVLGGRGRLYRAVGYRPWFGLW